MITFRPFQNTDPPQIVEVWRSQAPLRGQVHSVPLDVLERHVFSKAFFDREGFIVAVEDNRIVGFVHASFAPNESLAELDRNLGVVAQLKVVPHQEQDQIAQQLLVLAEAYLRSHGSKKIIAYGTHPSTPFYLGFYGGSRLSGILASDEQGQRWFSAAGYSRGPQSFIMQTRLSNFRPCVNRQQMVLRRSSVVVASYDPLPKSWWEACIWGHSERILFVAQDKSTGRTQGKVMFWDMEPLATSWGVRVVGMNDLTVESNYLRQGVATFMIGESLRQLASHGVSIAECQISDSHPELHGLLMKLGFEKVDSQILLEKKID